MLKIAPINEPLTHTFRLVLSTPEGIPLLHMTKRYRFMRVEGRVSLHSGQVVGTVKSPMLHPIRNGYSCFDQRGKGIARLTSDMAGSFVVTTPDGAEAATVSPRAPYRLSISREVSEPLRGLLIAIPVILDLSRGYRL